MAFAYQASPGNWVEIAGPFSVGGLQYPYNWPDLATSQERAARGIKQISEPVAPAAGLAITGQTLSDVNGTPARNWVTQAAVPQVVSRLQAKLALAASGQLDTVETAVAAASRNVQIYWAEADPIHRTHPVLEAMRLALGWTSGAVDQLFVAASQIT